MNGSIVVADTSPLIALATMELLVYLDQLFAEVFIPPAVYDECVSDLSKPAAAIINDVIAAGIIKVSKVENTVLVNQLMQRLDMGESQAIVMAMEKSATILIDEKLGRRIAKSNGLLCKGSLFCLVECKKQGLVKSAKECINKLQKAGYYLDQKIISTVLEICGEH